MGPGTHPSTLLSTLQPPHLQREPPPVDEPLVVPVLLSGEAPAPL